MEQTPQLKKQVQYVSFSSRVLAALMDSVLITFLVLPIFVIFSSMVYGSGENPADLLFPIMEAHMKQAHGLYSGLHAFLTDERTIQIAKEHHIVLKKTVEFVVQSIILFVVIFLFWIYRAATPGKMLLSMRIADAKTFEKPTRKQFVLRFLGYGLSFLPFFLGFFWIALDKRRRGFHDMIAGTVVIKK